MVNNMMDMFPVAVKQLTPVTNILNLMAKGPVTGPLSLKEVYAQRRHIVSIVQIGAGGTGGYVAAEIMRIIGGLPAPIQESIYYTLMDGDEFEAKNLGRQLCTEDDIGVNKAVALIENYADYYGVMSGHARAVPQYLKDIHQLLNVKACVLDNATYVIFCDKDKFPDRVNGKAKEGMCQGSPHINELVEEGLISKVDAEELTSFNEHFKDTYVYYDNPNQRRSEGKGFDDLVTARVSANGIHWKALVTTIFIDCVDKTTPRKLIHDFLESQYALPKIVDYLKSYSSPCGDIPLDNPEISESEYSIAYTLDSELYVAPAVNVLVPLPATFSGDKNVNIATHYGNSDTYIISSGNGKYTGQVYWGRYSKLIPDTRPVRYDDIWSVHDRGYSTIVPKNPKSSFDFEAYENLSDRDKMDIWRPAGYEFSDDKFIFNMIYKSYMYDHTYTIPQFFADQFRENVGFRSLLELPYEWDEKVGTYTIDEEAPILDNLDSYLSAFVSVPSPYLRNPDLIDDSKDAEEEQMSCAERAVQNVQNIAANKTAANLVVNYFRSIINGMFPLEKDACDMLSTVGVSFDTRTNTFKPELLTKTYLREYDSYKQWKDSGREYFSNYNTIRGAGYV